MAVLSAKLEKLINELLGKNLLREETALSLSQEKREIDARLCLLGILDAQVEEGGITREQADQYVLQLGFTVEELDVLRSELRESQERKRHLN